MQTGEHVTLELVEKALWSMRQNAKLYAKAKSERIYLQEYRKSLKAILMNEKTGEPQHARESFAYADKRYTDHLQALKTAIE